MQRIVIIGAGGHAQVVADILMRARDAGEALTPIGYVDDNHTLHSHTLLGLPVLGATDDLRHLDYDSVIIALGANETRSRIYEQLRREGRRMAIARHPSAIIAPDVIIGPGTMICAGAVINPGSVLGANVILNTGSTIDHHNQIGNYVHIAPGVHTGGDVAIGEGTLIGIGATVLPQVHIGAWSVIGAGAVVHRHVPDRIVVTGVPARPLHKATGNRPSNSG